MNNDMAKLMSVPIIMFLILFDPAIAWAHIPVDWAYYLTGPDNLNGTMSIVQTTIPQGKILSSVTQLKRGVVGSDNLHSRLLIHSDGSTISYVQRSFAGRREIYSLQLHVLGRKITGAINQNGQTNALHYKIHGANPRVYIMGNNLLNGVQALLDSLKGDSVQKEVVLYPMKGEWYRAILKPGRVRKWNTVRPISAIPVQLKLQSGGVTVSHLTLWCTPQQHFLLAMKEGPILITRSELPPSIVPQKTNVNQMKAFFTQSAGKIFVVHTHITTLGRSMLGTLTVPTNRSILGSILLIPGSGPTNRDGNNPYGLHDYIYKQLAYDLAKKGYAMLRYNKASISPATEKRPPSLSLKLYAEDAATWFVWMKKQKELRNSKFYLIGHSAGGVVALYAISMGLIHPYKLVLLACPGVRLGKILTSQMKYQAAIRNAPESEIKNINKNVKTLLFYIHSEHGETLKLNAGFMKKFPVSSFFTQTGILPLLKSEFAINPAHLIKQVRVPTLIVQGEKDIQVLPMNGTKLHEANLQYTRLLCLPNLSHDLTEVKNVNQVLNPAPPGTPLYSQLISVIADFLSTEPQRNLKETKCKNIYSTNDHIWMNKKSSGEL